MTKPTKFRRLLCWACFALLLSNCKPADKPAENIDAWYKHIRIYNLDIKTFKDSDNDGLGDIRGLTSKLDYLQNLGVNAIWLAPFQPSAQKDDGYDVTDYYSIDPKLGTDVDFATLLREAKARHIKVVMDLILNHTSDEHPWFKEARSGIKAHQNWYLWAKDRPNDWDKGMGFPVVEKETWRFDTIARQYFFHRFYRFQPDLNFQNKQVLQEAEKILGFWLNKGLDGFRLDAVPFIIDDPRESAEKPKEDYNILHKLCLYVKKQKPDAVLLGEANVEPKDNALYFGQNGNGLQMMFNFYANQYLFYGLATGDAEPFKKALDDTKQKPGAAQWAWFLRNHDEIDLGRLSKGDMQKVYKEMGPDTSMQLYDRGIRRRLAPMLKNDPNRLKLAYSLLYSLPGTPVIRYGEELGMGDDLSLHERLAVRTPMQWDGSKNAGFTGATTPVRPVIQDNIYGYQKVNVKSEEKAPSSLYNFVHRMLEVRKQHPEIDNGEWKVLNTSDETLAIEYNDHGRRLLVCHNFSDKPQNVNVDAKATLLHSILTGPSAKIKDGKVDANLPPYGFQWFQLN